VEKSLLEPWYREEMNGISKRELKESIDYFRLQIFLDDANLKERIESRIRYNKRSEYNYVGISKRELKGFIAWLRS